jgi:hypothetical protein
MGGYIEGWIPSLTVRWCDGFAGALNIKNLACITLFDRDLIP